MKTRLKTFKSLWKNYKYRFTPWIAFNLSKEAKKPKEVWNFDLAKICKWHLVFSSRMRIYKFIYLVFFASYFQQNYLFNTSYVCMYILYIFISLISKRWVSFIVFSYIFPPSFINLLQNYPILNVVTDFYFLQLEMRVILTIT